MPAEDQPPGTLLVLDTASLYYRSFFALPVSMTAPDGRPHNAVRGFLSTLARLIESQRATGVVACWDNDWRPAWRVALVPSYKAHRVAEETADPGAGGAAAGEAEPPELGPQVEAIASLLDAAGIARWGVDEYEADDVAASVCTQVPQRCVVVTGDRDLVQLVSHRTNVLLTVNGGMEKWPLLDPTGVQERFGVDPERYVDLAVLRGDPSDGLPGVAGIGPKTAVALVSSFGAVPDVLEAARTSPKERPMTPRLAEALTRAADAVTAALAVATVTRDLDLPERSTLLPSTPADPGRLAALGAEWGVERQVDALWSAIRGQTDAE